MNFPLTPSLHRHHYSRRCADGRHIVLLLTLTTLLVPTFAESARAQAEDGADAVQLAEQRWAEQAYGLSVRPPADAEWIEQPKDGALAHFRVDDAFTIRIYLENVQDKVTPETDTDRSRRPSLQVRPNRGEIDLENVKSWATRQIAFANPNARILEDEMTQVSDRPAARLMFKVRPKGESAWILGQVFMKIDPYTVVRFDLEADADTEQQARAAFDAMLATVELEDPQVLDERRKTWIQNGQEWVASLEQTDVSDKLVAEQWQRILEDGRDVGYIRIRQEQARELGYPGIRIEVSQRLETEQGIVDTVSEFFESASGTTELWSIRSARRDEEDLKARLPDQAEVQELEAWADTGLRSRDKLTISREGPDHFDNNEWPQLPEAYLSQVDLHLLPSLLSPTREVTLAFYAYYSKTGRIGLRTLRVEPLSSGGYRVYDRPALHRGEQVTTYDAQGRLIQRQMADGRTIVPSSEERVLAIWRER